MKISLNWIKEYTAVDIAPEELIEKIGAQLGAVEEVTDLGQMYAGIVVAKVMACEKHLNADKLSVCLVDDRGVVPGMKRDENGLVEVVCGAPNVREGMVVAWLPPGVTVPSSFHKQPFVLEARDIRGVVSNGMLASAAELALGDDHSGLLELSQEIAPGTRFADAFNLNDILIDIENKMFTHRPDCFGVLGVAREIAGIQHQKFTSPDWYLDVPSFGTGSSLPINVMNDFPELVPRFMAVSMSGVKVGPSPAWLQADMTKVGLKPINNIVDITNYLMYLTGQPLHAYDYDKVADRSGNGASIVIRHAHAGETLQLLNGKNIEPRPEAIMIATDQQLIGVGGVMGGSDTEVDETTRNIILECANFDMYSIRRTAMAHGLFTDAVTRFNKGQSPFQNDRVLKKAIDMVHELSGGNQASEVTDRNALSSPGEGVDVGVTFINERLGLNFTSADIKTLLENVEFTVVEVDGILTVTAPFWRTDIQIAEDIVEEVGRLYGFDKLPLVLPRSSIQPAVKDGLLELKADIRKHLSNTGANEVLTYSFVHGNLLAKVGQKQDLAFKLGNALSPDLQFYRISLMPSLIDKVHANIKAGYSEFALYEIGKAHIKGLSDQLEPDVPQELQRVAMVFTSDEKTSKANYEGAAYFQAAHYLNSLMSSLNVAHNIIPIEHEPSEEVAKQTLAPFEPSRTGAIMINEKLAGFVGEFRNEVGRALKLPVFTAGFEIDLSVLAECTQMTSYKPLPRYPRVEQDMSLRVDAKLSCGELKDFVELKLKELKPDNSLLNVSVVDIYQRPEDTDFKQITLRIHIASYERTLKAEEVNQLLETVAEHSGQKFGAVRI